MQKERNALKRERRERDRVKKKIMGVYKEESKREIRERERERDRERRETGKEERENTDATFCTRMMHENDALSS